MVAEKWNFPEFITETITHHHSPLDCPEKYRDIITIVYLSNMLCEIEKKNFEMSYIETAILEDMGLTERKDFDGFLDTIKTRFEIHYYSIRN